MSLAVAVEIYTFFKSFFGQVQQRFSSLGLLGMLLGGPLLRGFGAEPLLCVLFLFVATVHFLVRQTPAAALDPVAQVVGES